MAGASALGSMFGGSEGGASGGGGGMSLPSPFPSMDGGTQTSSSGSTDAQGGAGWLVQASPFTINSGGSTMSNSGGSEFSATQHYTPHTDLASNATTTPTNTLAKDGGTLTQALPLSLPAIPRNYLYLGAFLLAALVLVIALPSKKRR